MGRRRGMPSGFSSNPDWGNKGSRNKKQKGFVEVEAEPAGRNDNREIENFPEQTPPVEEEEMHCRMSPLSHSYPNMRDNFPKHAESSKRNEGTAEIMDMLRSMKK